MYSVPLGIMFHSLKVLLNVFLKFKKKIRYTAKIVDLFVKLQILNFFGRFIY